MPRHVLVSQTEVFLVPTPYRRTDNGLAADPGLRIEPDVPRCAACGSTKVTRIGMTLTDGTPVEFTSCLVCEHKTWAHDGRELPRDVVLEKTRKIKDGKTAPQRRGRR